MNILIAKLYIPAYIPSKNVDILKIPFSSNILIPLPELAKALVACVTDPGCRSCRQPMARACLVSMVRDRSRARDQRRDESNGFEVDDIANKKMLQ